MGFAPFHSILIWILEGKRMQRGDWMMLLICTTYLRIVLFTLLFCISNLGYVILLSLPPFVLQESGNCSCPFLVVR